MKLESRKTETIISLQIFFEKLNLYAVYDLLLFVKKKKNSSLNQVSYFQLIEIQKIKQ
jgi:hypothetical protein